MKSPADKGTAYLFWCLGLLGFCGGQRIYLGRTGSGILYFCTLGLLGIGQFVDLFLIPEMVEERNLKLRGMGYQYDHRPQATIEQVQPADHMSELLKAAKDNKGVLSPAQVAMVTRQSPDQIKLLIDEAIRHGYCEIKNDPESGRIRYEFDV